MRRVEKIPERAEPQPPAETPIKAHVSGLQGYGFISLAVVIVVAALSLAQGFFVPVVVAFVLSLALARVVRRLQHVMPRWVAAALVVLALISVAGAPAGII